MHIYKGALTANAASLGLNWIYNIPYLEKLADKEDILFIPIDPAKYKRAGKAFNGYPNAEVGDVSLQGRILKWFYETLEDNPDFTPEDYRQLLIDHLKPGGPYEGWVESYGKKLVFNHLISDLKLEVDPIDFDDDQLVGFVPYLALKTFGEGTDKAFEFAKVLTSNEDYIALYGFFDQILGKAKDHSLKEAIEHAINHAPDSYHKILRNAMETKDLKHFLRDNNLNTACAIDHAIPLIVHILYHTESFEEAVHENTKIGGASSDRGLLLGAVLAEAYGVPEKLLNKTNL
ncbi:MAG: ADP-ribosylglycohydrolase family protein [Bacillota bacterium]